MCCIFNLVYSVTALNTYTEVTCPECDTVVLTRLQKQKFYSLFRLLTIEREVNGLQVVSLSSSWVRTNRKPIWNISKGAQINKKNLICPTAQQKTTWQLPASFSRTRTGYWMKSFLIVTSSDVHSSRLSFWATTLATEKLSQPKASAIQHVREEN